MIVYSYEQQKVAFFFLKINYYFVLTIKYKRKILSLFLSLPTRFFELKLIYQINMSVKSTRADFFAL